MKQQRGFSLIEIFISLAVGTVLLGGVLAAFVSMRVTTTETTSFGSLQENGRFAVQVLTEDLIRVGFWGDLSGELTTNRLTQVPNQNATDCVGGGANNTSFPQDIGHYREIWGETSTSASGLGCITNASVGSDILQLKRVVSSTTAAADVAADRYYLMTNMNQGAIFAGDEAIPTIDNGNIWEYQHYIYYVREDTVGDNTIPVLVKGLLRNDTNPPILFDPIIDGVEMIRFTYGVDTDNDGVVNSFVSADDMTQALWDNEGDNQILAVTMYVLVRDLYPDFDYENKNTYTLGDISVDFMNAEGEGDNFRRMLFSSTVTLYNTRTDSW
ncbi:type IV minor pilin protein PilW [Thalassotalea loyana]|uniref:Type IV minor pilin protein PilW n=1 Tax=Thalassotalea loyana TaxID=280483 RepID=A0ABQ6HC83_9GAMM|nr:PilW family protein [Thalassotalea loyana]GLX85722.1 type IV minor pilin protein PilW [Thalassotalea loyana]